MNPYRCIVLEVFSLSHEDNQVKEFVKKLKENFMHIPNGRHFQIIIYLALLGPGHYLMIHIQKIEGKLFWLILDTANYVLDFDSRVTLPFEHLYNMFSKIGAETPYVFLPSNYPMNRKTMQNDKISCPIFALQNSHVISLYENIFIQFQHRDYSLKILGDLKYYHLSYLELPVLHAKLLLLSQAREVRAGFLENPLTKHLVISSKMSEGKKLTLQELCDFYDKEEEGKTPYPSQHASIYKWERYLTKLKDFIVRTDNLLPILKQEDDMDFFIESLLKP